LAHKARNWDSPVLPVSMYIGTACVCDRKLSVPETITSNHRYID